MADFEIPLIAAPMEMSIPIAGATYRIRTSWNHIGEQWQMDLSAEDGEPILSSIPLVTGYDMLEQYEYLGLGFKLACGTNSDPDARPTAQTLGDTAKLYARV